MKITKCLHCGNNQNNERIVDGVCHYCYCTLSSKQLETYKSISRGEISQCSVCGEFLNVETSEKLELDFDVTSIENDVCYECDHAFAVV